MTDYGVEVWEWIDNLRDSISELEKKFKTNDVQTYIFNKGIIKKNEERISELEIQFETWKSEYLPYDLHKKTMEEIAELRDALKNRKTMEIEHQRQLSELKERVDNAITIEDLLEKLDGKKESDFTPEAIQNIVNYLHKEDSGGDKVEEVRRSHPLGEPSPNSDISLHSKQPEPSDKWIDEEATAKLYEPRENDFETDYMTIDQFVDEVKKHDKLLISEFVEKLSKDWRGMTWEELLDYIYELKEEYEEKLK